MFLLGGCASTAYVPPVSGPVAELTLYYESTVGGASANAWQNDQCEGRMYLTDFKGIDKFTTTVPADKRFYLSYVWVTTVPAIAVCYLNSSFIPKQGIKYESDLIVQDGKCYMPIYRVEGEKRIPEATAVSQKPCKNY